MVDPLIRLFKSTSTSFETNGLGSLVDAISCSVTEERNGEYELICEYPVFGRKYDQLSLRQIIVVKPNPYSDPQPFRIYQITKPLNGIVTINAEHISYDLSGYPVSPFTANTVVNALIKLKESSVVPCPFTFSTDKTTTSEILVAQPASIRSLLGGTEGSLIDTYGGEYEFDNFSVKLCNARGLNRGVTIRYGKNLTDINQEENCSSVYTGVYPYWYSETDGIVQTSSKIINVDGNYNFTRILPLDWSSVFQEKPTEAQIIEATNSYIKTNNIGVPKININVSFIPLSQTDEYKNYALLETVRLCDTVSIYFPEIGIKATAKCIKTEYDVISDRYISISLGDAKSDLASKIADQSQLIQQTPTKTFMEKAIDNATKLISGGLGGYVVFNSSSEGRLPDEILIMDTDDIKTAVKVWRWNKAGLGYSKTGYNGPYSTAMTQDGQIVADFINTGTMSANRINGGTLVLGGLQNASGTALIKDEFGKTLVTLDDRGITLSESVNISYDNHIATVTKNTVTSEYINALKVAASSVTCTSSDDMHEADISGGCSFYKYNGLNVGLIGTNTWAETSRYGLDINLDTNGDHIMFASKTDGGNKYYVAKLTYSKNDYGSYKSDTWNAGCAIDMHNFELRNVKWPSGGVTTDMQFVQVLDVDASGTVTKWGANGRLKFVNGILVDASIYTK